MASSTTLYANYHQSSKLIDQTVGFAVKGDELRTHLGNAAGHWERLNGQDALAWLQTRYAKHVADVGWTELDAGQYYPRFYRGGYNYGNDTIMRELGGDELKEMMMAEEQVDIFDADLVEISRTVTPSVKNQKSRRLADQELAHIGCD